MVVRMDAVRYGAGFDAAGHWHDAEAEFVRPEEREARAKDLAPARGAVIGLILSGALWAGLVVGVRALLTLMR